MQDSPKFLLRIEGQGEYLQNAKWAWIHSVSGFYENQKCQACFNGKPILKAIHKKVKTGEDFAFNADSTKIPINPKIKGHNGEVLHYLCIDSSGKDYLHIGFIYEQGSEVRGEFMGQTIIIKNAKNLNFDFSENSEIGNEVREKYAHLDKPNTAKSCKVTECRNFWFGAYFYGDKI
ncbi:hypothetical protein ACWIUD_10960 [Helicobacter sp. 23-1044]